MTFKLICLVFLWMSFLMDYLLIKRAEYFLDDQLSCSPEIRILLREFSGMKIFLYYKIILIILCIHLPLDA